MDFNAKKVVLHAISLALLLAAILENVPLSMHIAQAFNTGASSSLRLCKRCGAAPFVLLSAVEKGGAASATKMEMASAKKDDGTKICDKSRRQRREQVFL